MSFSRHCGPVESGQYADGRQAPPDPRRRAIHCRHSGSAAGDPIPPFSTVSAHETAHDGDPVTAHAQLVLVCGSRDWPDPAAVHARLRGLPLGSRVIHGAARGADQQAATAARALGIPERAFPADWRGKGRRAGILRNLQMLDQAPGLVIAFQRAGSTGTQHTIDEARRRGVPVEVHTA